ncbi:hypothetical protein RM780_04070 [Streptomyces sp. DSM 44917]|uniref:Integral membrane protein n=1 Tax=Streptomyces boetiae TaxID=3075541 RepID=A0ABU2L3K8_9ACTN|nr:hypothetical protein [Streptomyces sp. DSM 44917]MDT0306139.1 hypothetical protein [Streptomyces sp. DSM 44917]
MPGGWWGARLGRRGQILLIAGVGEMSWGAGFLAEPAPNLGGLAILARHGGVDRWAWVWVACGLAAVVAAFVRIGRDWPGFAAALAPPLVWAFAYMAAALVDDYTRGAWVAVWYLNWAFFIMWASAVPEHSVPPSPRARRGREPWA